MDPVLVLLALVVIALAFSLSLRQMRLRWTSRVKLSDDEANMIRAELLDYVKTRSFGEGYEVSLLPFWQERRLSEADKGYVASPLFEDRILLVMKKVRTGSWEAVFEKMVEVWVEKVLMPIPEMVVLNPQVYYRMLHEDISGKTIIMEQVVGHQQIDARIQSFRADANAQVSGVTIGDRSSIDQ
jgi:ribulose bisphosphate carboxylase small subunit